MAYLYEDTKDSKYIPYLEQWAEWVMEEMPRTNEGACNMRHMDQKIKINYGMIR